MPLFLKRIGVLGLLGFFSLAAFAPMFTVDVWYINHDVDAYLYKIQEFKGIFDNGQWFPRWAPRLLGGYGYPSFVFSQPGAFFYLLPFLYLPLSLPAAMKLAIYGMYLMGGGGCYFLARHFGMDRFVAAMFSSIYLFMPYAYADVFIRGDLSEFLAMMCCPWVMLGVMRIRADLPGPVRWSSLALYVLPLTAVFYSHPHVALFVILTIGWFTLVDWVRDGMRSRSAWALVLGGAMAAVLSAPYWVTVLSLKSNILLNEAMDTVRGSMSWGQLFYRTEADSYPWLLPTVGILSLYYVGLACIGLILAWPSRLFWQILPPLFFSVYLNTDDSLWLWHALPGSPYLQFVWRVASVSGILQYMAMLHMNQLRRRFSAGDYYVAVTAVVIVGIFLQPSVEYDSARGHYRLAAFSYNRYFVRLQELPDTRFLKPFTSTETAFVAADNTGRGEFDPKWLKAVPLLSCITRRDDEAATPSDPRISLQVEHALLPYRIKGSLTMGEEAFPQAPAKSGSLEDLPSITLKAIYFPGWHMSINGQPIVFAENEGTATPDAPAGGIDPYGRIRIFFPHPGHYDFDGYYEGPPYWQARNIAMAVAMLALCLIFSRYRQSGRRT